MSDFDPLVSFAQWFVLQKIDCLNPVAVYNFGQVVSLVLYRKAPFQAELFIVVPGGGFPEEHRHPNVDSFEVDMFGDIALTVNGKPGEPVFTNRSDGSDKPLSFTRVRPTDFHGANSIKNGGSFLSIQHWLNGVEPTSVGLNWEGTPVSEEHSNLLDPFEMVKK